MYSGGNTGYWISHPLGDDELQVLRKVNDGVQSFDRDRLQVAYLIAMGLVKANLGEGTLSVTEKGIDGIEFFG